MRLTTLLDALTVSKGAELDLGEVKANLTGMIFKVIGNGTGHNCQIGDMVGYDARRTVLQPAGAGNWSIRRLMRESDGGLSDTINTNDLLVVNIDIKDIDRKITLIDEQMDELVKLKTALAIQRDTMSKINGPTIGARVLLSMLENADEATKILILNNLI